MTEVVLSMRPTADLLRVELSIGSERVELSRDQAFALALSLRFAASTLRDARYSRPAP